MKRHPGGRPGIPEAGDRPHPLGVLHVCSSSCLPAVRSSPAVHQTPGPKKEENRSTQGVMKTRLS